MSDDLEQVTRRPRLLKLTIQNFRCIGECPIEVDLDDIVVLVGPNNAGKSSILRAYEVVMSDGSADSSLTLEDFPSGKAVEGQTPVIELETVVFDDKPGAEWCGEGPDGGSLVRERWRWSAPGKPVRVGFNVTLGRWAEDGDPEKVPWGAPAVANARRPQPHRVSAFDPPEEQTDEILRLLDAVLEEKLKAYREEDPETSKYAKLVKNVVELQTAIVEESRENIERMQADLSKLVEKVFPRHSVVFDPRPDQDVAKGLSFFSARSQLRMGPEGGFQSTIDKQGSGARRTLLWTALKLLADEGVRARAPGSKAKKPLEMDPKRPHVLLMDEPEICLHPSAIREACSLLYDLPSGGSWQVMITTHSPCFVDFTRDNTTIVRVERSASGGLAGSTIYRPQVTQLDDDDKSRLKLLNLCDPYVAEFFFGGRCILVEGDTEHTAFAHLRQMHPDDFRDMHVVRARGKATIVSLMKILNHFGAPYAVLHDTDRKTAKRRDGQKITNPAWTKNADILAEAQKAEGGVVHIACVPNFEEALFDGPVANEKPYSALVRLRERTSAHDKVRQLLTCLSGASDELPAGTMKIIEQGDFDGLEL